jgi:hypothetical protein
MLQTVEPVDILVWGAYPQPPIPSSIQYISWASDSYSGYCLTGYDIIYHLTLYRICWLSYKAARNYILEFVAMMAIHTLILESNNCNVSFEVLLGVTVSCLLLTSCTHMLHDLLFDPEGSEFVWKVGLSRNFMVLWPRTLYPSQF